MKRSTAFFCAALMTLGAIPSASASNVPGADQTQLSITLKWSARNETAVYGYLIYRSERRQGPFLRLNDEIIHVEEPAVDSSVNSYEYLDSDVVSGTTYYYYLDTISSDGRKGRFSGIIKKTAPTPASTPETG
jgi:hypothetical protein